MKNVFIAALALGSLTVSAQSLPEFIQGYEVVQEERALFEEPQPCWVVYGKDVDTFADLFYKVVDNSVLVNHEEYGNGEIWIHQIDEEGLSCAIYVHDTQQSSSRLVFYYFAE